MSVLALDLETTGVDPETARIVTAALVLLDDAGKVEMSQEWVVRPDGCEIPVEATAVHGVTTEIAQERGVPLRRAIEQIGRVIQAECGRDGVPLALQNAAYDLTILDREGHRAFPGARIEDLLDGIPVLDSLVIDRKLVQKRRGSGARRLEALAKAYGVPLSAEEAHGATADATAAGRIVLKQLEHDRLRGIPADVIHEAQRYWRVEQQVELQKWLRANKDPDAVCDVDWPFIPRSAA